MRKHRKILKIIIAVSLFMLVFSSPMIGSALPGERRLFKAELDNTVGESRDFASLVLHDHWDMSEFTDISQWLNHNGSEYMLEDIRVQDGVFSARTSPEDPNFSLVFLLYPGYLPGVRSGKIGVLHPIPTQTYSCFYAAMSVEVENLGYAAVTWIKDQSLDQSGYTYGIPVTTETWRLYQVDLKSYPSQGELWVDNNWQGLTFRPTNQPSKSFSVDWIRLTDCSPVYYKLSNLASGSYSLWVGTGSPERQILVVESFSPDESGSYLWDLQGIAPGKYQYYVKSLQGDFILRQGELNIEAAPIPKFTHPSPLAGEDYSTQAGNPWDMESADDLVSVLCADWSVRDGLLNLDTKPPSRLGSKCIGSGVGEADPIVYLNTPDHGDMSAYRYFSFRHKINGNWSLPEKGMIVRWIWRVQHPTETNRFCEYVSREIALEVGWQTYMIDLYDPWNGYPVEVGEYPGSPCPKGIHWTDQNNKLLLFRFDPNENITSNTFHQEVDWIRLTKVVEVKQGIPFPIQISLNKPPDRLQTYQFYYTDDPNDPDQHPVLSQAASTKADVAPVGLPSLESPFQVYLPVAMEQFNSFFLPPVENEIRHKWDTSEVPPGEYYVCAIFYDGYNQTTSCSDAPLKVIP